MMRLLSIVPLLLALGVLSGCNTFDRRAQQKADTFATLSPETQERLQNKVLKLGDSPDMVYIALGSPDEKKVTTTGEVETLTWTYNRYWQEYRGEEYSGFHRRVVTNPQTGVKSVYFEPMTRPVYAQRQQPVMRVFFTGGKVTMIEEAKR